MKEVNTLMLILFTVIIGITTNLIIKSISSGEIIVSIFLIIFDVYCIIIVIIYTDDKDEN